MYRFSKASFQFFKQGLSDHGLRGGQNILRRSQLNTLKPYYHSNRTAFDKISLAKPDGAERTPIKPNIYQKLDDKDGKYSRHSNSWWEFERASKDSFHFLQSALGGLSISAGLAVVAYTMYKVYFEPRERVIIADMIGDGYDVDISSGNLTHHGSLGQGIIEYDGDTFLKKGAKSRDCLLREFVLSIYLNSLLPESQPRGLLYQEPISEFPGKARFFTLSHMDPRSIDIEDFIVQGDWKQRLQEKPLRGLWSSLALIFLIAGQQDNKFANMIITEHEDHFRVALIDFELSGKRFFSINERMATTDIGRLISSIRDLQMPDEQFSSVHDFKLGLTGDPRGREFIDYVIEQFSAQAEEEIMALYRRVAAFDHEPILNILDFYADNSDLVGAHDLYYWRKELGEIRDTAACYLSHHDDVQAKLLNGREGAYIPDGSLLKKEDPFNEDDINRLVGFGPYN